MRRSRLRRLVASAILFAAIALGSLAGASRSAAAPGPLPARKVIVRHRAIRRAFPQRPPRPVIVPRPRRLVVRRAGSNTVVMSGSRVLRKFPAPVVISTAEDLEDVPVQDLSELPAYKVVRINEDCSVVVQMESVQTTLRMIGVEAAEAQNHGVTDAATASSYLRNLLSGEFVHLEFDPDFVQEDEDGKKMAYIRRAPDGLLVNLELLRTGHALADTDYVYQHHDLYSFYESKARADGKGIWYRPPGDDDGEAGQPACTVSADLTPATQPAGAQ